MPRRPSASSPISDPRKPAPCSRPRGSRFRLVSSWTPAERDAIWLSLRVATVAVSASLVPALATAWLLARHRFWGRSLVNACVHLPLVVPPVVTGYALLRLFGHEGPVGRWLYDTAGISVAFRWTGA